MYNPYLQQQGGFNPPQQPANFGDGSNNQQQYNQGQATGVYNPGTSMGMGNQAMGFYGTQQGNAYGNNSFQPQATGFAQTPVTQAPTGYLQTQPTGFQPPGGGSTVTVKENVQLKIPNMRLSFITASDQNKFEHLFRTAVPPGEQAISGDSARDILLRSGLAPVTLAEIWSLADTNKSGSLLFPEFALSLHLCNLSLKGDSLPQILPEKWLNEVKSFVDAISFSVPEDSSKILADTPFAVLDQNNASNRNNWLPPQATGFNPGAPPMTSFQAQPTGFGNNSLTSQRTGGGSLIPLNPQQTSSLIPTNATGVNQPQTTGLQLPAQRTGLGSQSAGSNPAGTSFTQQQTGLQQGTNFGSQSNILGGSQTALPRQSTGYQPSSLLTQTTGFLQQPTLQAQTTGFNSQNSLVSQNTGRQSFGEVPRQNTGIQPQLTGLQQQSTGYYPLQSSFQLQTTGLQSQGTGFQSQPTGMLQAQPTGRPGEWGFVSMPTGGIPGLNAMEQHFMPSSLMSSNNLQNVMGGSLKSNVTWAITKQEKQIYDGIFAAWDPSNKGFLNGDVAINIFGKSGLLRPDLESIWNLVDSNNRGKLNKDEFAVAMHLVYRRLNGFDIPLRLPPELVPPSTKYIEDSVATLKNSLKNSSSARSEPKDSKADGRRYKNDDSNVGYVSNSRHRRKGTVSNDTKEEQKAFSAGLSAEDLKKLIKEKQILLDAIDAEDQDSQITSKQQDYINQDAIEFLKSKIKAVQDQLSSTGGSGASVGEKKLLLDKLNHLTRDVVPRLISDIHKVDRDLHDSRIKLFVKKLQKENPDWKPNDTEANIVGTGANGEVTDSDRRKFKSKQLLKQRMAALTGKPIDLGNKDLDSILQKEIDDSNRESEKQSSIISDIESSIKDLEDGCATFLQVTNREESGLEKWEKGTDVSPEVSTFIKKLIENSTSKVSSNGKSLDGVSSLRGTHQGQTSNAPKETPTASPSSAQHTYKTPEDRAAYIKAQAEKRMNERLAKLGISRSKGGFTSGLDAPKSKEVSSESSTKKEVTPHQNDAKVGQVNDKTAEPVAKEAPANNQERGQPQLINVGEDSSAEEDDAEYQALLKQKEEMEKEKKDQKLKKKQMKEAKLAKLKQEMERLKQKEEESSSDEETPVVNVQTFKPRDTGKQKQESQRPQEQEQEQEKNSEVSHNNASISKPKEPENISADVLPDNAGKVEGVHRESSHANNPFAKPSTLNNSNLNLDSRNVAPPSTNPFFKAQPTGEAIDPKKAEAQRNSQRGLADADDWSDEEEHSSDDDGPNRAGAAKLASLLFGGMSQPPRQSEPASSENSTKENLHKEEVYEENSESAGDDFSTPPPAPDMLASKEITNMDVAQDSRANSFDEYHSFQEPNEEEPVSNQRDILDSPPLPNASAPPPPPIPTDLAPSLPVAPPPPAPPIPSDNAASFPMDSTPLAAPPPPPPAPPAPAPPAPPAPLSLSSSGASSGSKTVAPTADIGALLGQIKTGASLKKVKDNEKKESTGATVGKVL